ncbi:lipopolysaccharide biosynthesis protein [Bradyrhizobium symbiodeficiens]|uniref:lipopolysaccharide biosynthesis protein n=1 Tax=Bradyrhizobium symbiodeficiens TaxID=1404367 RepID=UPI00140FEAC3|nr:lipopolysaccharide biosynthesis protein [Bradyrhizobium symbiodeficiens]QIP01733.1 lipopolysaccharide biosynthesis protein [Bradyrhizobium symbiodeficiens]
MRAYIREIAWVIVAQAAAFIGGLATVKTAAAVLGPAEYGKLSVALAVVGIVQVCLYGAISQTATRFLAYASSHNLIREYERSLAKLVGFCSAVVCVFWIGASTFGVSSWLPLPIGILCIYAVINGIQIVLIATCNAARRRKFVAILQLAEAIIRPIFIVALTRIAAATANHAFVGYILSTSTLVGAIIVAWSFSSRIERCDPDPDPDQIDESVTGEHLAWSMTSFAIPFVVFGLLGALGSHGERLLLASWASWADVGSYALMAQLAMAPNVLFTTVVNQFYFPLVFQFDPRGTREIKRSFRLYLLISILGIVGITVAVAASGALLIPIFSTKAFLGHEHLLWFLGVSAGLFCIAQQLVLPGLRLNRPGIYMPAKLVHSLVLLGLSLVLVPAWGVDGMGVASLLSSTAYLAATMLANVWLKRNLNPTKRREP